MEEHEQHGGAQHPQFLGILYIATAGQNGFNLGTDEQDIVLISISILHKLSKKVLCTKHILVCPESKSSLSDDNSNDCVLSEESKSQLNITDDLIKSDGVPLQQAINQLDELLKTHEWSDSLVLVTEGQLPLRQCVHPEASTKDINLPDYYYSFFDLKKEFYSCFDHTNPIEHTNDMVAFLELKINHEEFDENDNSNDSTYKYFIHNMTAVVIRLLQDANTFQHPETIMEKLEPGICSKNETVDGNSVVRARGLPWQSSDQDIAKFFRGLNIAKGGVALCLSPQGRRNGEALIRFESQEHRDIALKRHKHHIANRYIEVYKASGDDFLSVAGGNNNEAQAFLSKGGQVIVRMRGLPYDCNAKQVVDFFDSGEKPCKVLDETQGVLFVKRPDGRATGDAFVQFQYEEDAINALAKHRESIGARYIELFRSTTAEVQQVLNRCVIGSNSSSNNNSEPLLKTLPSELMVSNNGPLIGQIVPTPVVPAAAGGAGASSQILPQHIITSGTRKDCIRLRGLPYEAQVEHILEFLGEHAKNIVYQGVHMVYNAQGQPSGEAFIQMDSESSAYLSAQTKHHRYMHHFKKQRYIEVFQCSGEDMNLVLTGGVPKLSAQVHHVHGGGSLLGRNVEEQTSSASSSSNSLLAAVTTNTYVSHAHHHHHQYYAPHQTVLSSIPQRSSNASNTAAAAAAASSAYYHPATVFYWPYPSPPVSPTYYPHHGIVNHTLGIIPPNHHHTHPPMVTNGSVLEPGGVPNGGALLKYNGSSQTSPSDIRVLDVTPRSGGITEYIIDPHHHLRQHHPFLEKHNNSHYHHPHPHRHHHHHQPGNKTGHYMMELGLFMA